MNVAAAINVKAWNASSTDSRNTQVVGNLPLMDKATGVIGLQNVNTFIYSLGIDVHHPPPGSSHPSEAALSGTLNRFCTSYYSTFRTQVNFVWWKFIEISKEQRSEKIPEIKALITEYLNEAFKKLKTPFVRLVIIRDGVADTQFTSVCKGEIDSIKEAVSEVSE